MQSGLEVTVKYFNAFYQSHSIVRIIFIGHSRFLELKAAIIAGKESSKSNEHLYQELI